MKLKIISVLLLTFILTACTSQEYKDQMKVGEQALAEKKYEEAVAAFSTAIEEEPNDQQAKDQLAEAKNQLAKAKRLEEEKKKKEVEAKVLESFSQGKKAFEDKQFSLSISHLSELISKYNGNTDVKEYIDEAQTILDNATIEFKLDEGKKALEEERYTDAVAVFEFVLEKNPDNKDVKALLVSAQKKENERHIAIFSQLVLNKDSLTGQGYYMSQETNSLVNSQWGNLMSGIYVYVTVDEQGSNPTLRMVSRYFGKSFIFYNNLLFRIDDVVYTMPAKAETDIDSGTVTEWEDSEFDPLKYDLINRIIKSTNDVSMRFVGDKDQYNMRLTDSSKKDYQLMLDTFVALGGDLSKYQ